MNPIATVLSLAAIGCLLLIPQAGLSQAAEQVAGSADEAREEEKPAILVADSVFITADRKLIAQGNVEAFQGDVRLSANRIEFDRETGQLTMTGPIRIDQGGQSTVLADYAQLDRSLQNGLLTGAKLVFNQQLQLSALQMTRVNGRYSQLYKTAVTSCHICEDGSPPLWQIRARKVTHDDKEGQLYFEDAQLRVLDIPVFYFPGMRLPDPTRARATGFLIPSVRTTSQLNTGIRVPYFFELGDHRDLTLAPYLSSKTRTLDWRYRQAFRRGRINLEGAFTRDDLQPGEDRGYVFATGQFELRDDFKFDFDIKTVSDDAYLLDYGLPDYDRLRSEISVKRSKRDEFFRASLIEYKSLRDGEAEEFLPTEIIYTEYERRFFPTSLGGELTLGMSAQAHRRAATADVLGRDMSQAAIDVNWQRRWIFASGVVADWQVGSSFEAFGIYDDTNYPPQVTRATPRTAVTLSLPMTRRDAAGGTHYLEPVIQLGWSDVGGPSVANEESNFVEFDQGNLLSLSRFPGNDQREDGITFVYGLNWARNHSDGWQARASIGQVFRENADVRYTETSGLSGASSDVLMAGQLALTNGLSITARGLLDGSLNFNKSELRGDWKTDTASLSGSFLWLDSDAAEGRTTPVSEVWLDGSYEVDTFWTASANVRYDIQGSRASRAGVGLVYQNECITVDLSLERHFTSTTSVEPTTDFGFTISLNGFAIDGNAEKYRRPCKHT